MSRSRVGCASEWTSNAWNAGQQPTGRSLGTGGGSFLCLSSDPSQSRIGAVICGNGFVPAALLSRLHA